MFQAIHGKQANSEELYAVVVGIGHHVSTISRIDGIVGGEPAERQRDSAQVDASDEHGHALVEEDGDDGHRGAQTRERRHAPSYRGAYGARQGDGGRGGRHPVDPGGEVRVQRRDGRDDSWNLVEARQAY